MAHRDSEYDEIRRRIERLRRRIDRNAGRLTDRTVRWIGWRSYLTRYPARSLAAAVGVGFVLSLVVSRIRLPRGFGARLYEFAFQGAWAQIWALLRQMSVRTEDGAEASAAGSANE